jgi:hypothetical protein
MNVELAKLVLKQITTFPESLDMGSWASSCGTTACIAGHTLLISGYTAASSGSCFFDPDRKVVPAGETAKKLLELTDEEYEDQDGLWQIPLFYLPAGEAIARLEKLIAMHEGE